MVRGILCSRSRAYRGHCPIYLRSRVRADISGLPLLDAIDVATHCARYKNEESDPGDRAGKLVGRRAAQRRWLPLRRGPTSHASRRRRKGGRFTAFDAVRARRTATTSTGPCRGRARGPRGCPRRPGARRWRAGIAWRPRVSFTVLGLVGELVGEAWQMPRRRRSGRCLRVDRCENPV